MSAGRLDVLVETGARWVRVVTLVRPDAPIVAAAIVAGSRVYVGGVPAHVADVTTSAGRSRLSLMDGLHGQPVLDVAASALFAPAVPLEVVNVAAAFSDDPLVAPHTPVPVEIPATIAADGLSFTLELTADVTATIPAGSYSWDCYAQTVEHDWQRVLEGTLSTVKGDSR